MTVPLPHNRRREPERPSFAPPPNKETAVSAQDGEAVSPGPPPAAVGVRGGRQARAQPAAPPRRRRARLWLNRFQLLTGIIVVISASVLVAWGLRRYLRTSVRFAIKTVVVDGNVRRTAHQLTQLAGAKLGTNIFAFDPQAAGAAVEADDWIERATVTRELPNTIRIEVTEREARALLAIKGRLYLADTKGNVFKELRPNDPQDLPIVTGIEPEEISEDREEVKLRLRRVFDLLSDLEAAEVAKRHPLQEVHLERDGRLIITVGSDGIALHFGQPPYRLKVEKVVRVLQEVRFRKVRVAAVFLDNEAHPERVVVRMR